ncbi:MAG: 30S ribosomal protein S6 [Alphaproteobacteria bacterium]
MAMYECVYIARQDISSNQVDGLNEAFSAVIAENGGTVAKTEYWGLRNLTYRIKKNRKGHYVLLNIDAPHAAVSELERQMRLHEDVLRNLTLRVDELEEGQSAMLLNKGDRGERGDRGDRGGRRDRFAGERGPRREGGFGDRDRGPRRERSEGAPGAAPASEGAEE